MHKKLYIVTSLTMMKTGIMNTGDILTLLAALFYLISLFLVISGLRKRLQNKQESAAPPTNRAFLIFWFAALLVHITALHYPLIAGQVMNLNFVTAGSYVMWLTNLILFITTLKRQIEILSVVILPITLVALVVPLIINTKINTVVTMHSGLGIHILFSLLGFSMLMLASFQALLLAVQNNKLHRHQNSRLMRTLPALEDMEHLLFRFIGIGVILLSIGLLSGFYYLDNLFGANIAHKTILSIIAWLVFSILLFGRWKYGWRGRKAVHWTLAGFIVLMLAFFGTKIIQEYLIPDASNQKQTVSNPFELADS